MTVTRTIVERCGVQISRVDSGRRVVYGEVMLPAPMLADGQRVAAAELEGRIHYDGGHMVAEDIVRLLDAFARERCPVDVMHDKTPRGATVVESWVVREPSELWTLGAWVVGAQIHEDDVWERVEAGELKAFSIQFIVNVERLVVTLVEDDGTERDVELFRFTDPRPQFLSLVDKPATGAYWKMKERAVRPLAGAIVDRTWDAAAARGRVEAWAKAEDHRNFADAYLTYDGAGGGHLVADVDGDRLVVVRQALADVSVDGLDDDDRRLLTSMKERDMSDEKKPDEEVKRDAAPVETPAEDVEPEPVVEPAPEPEGKDTEPEPEPVAELVEDPPEPEAAPVEPEAVEPEAEPEPEPEPAPIMYAVIDDKPVVAPEGYEGPLYTIDPLGGFAEVAVEPEPEATPEEPEVTPEAEPEAAPVQRGAFADTMADMIADREIDDMLWMGTSTLHDIFWRIKQSDDIEGGDQIPVMQQAVADFATWAIATLGEFGVETFAPQDSLLSFSRAEEVDRAGKKMAKKRLKKFKTAVETLAALISELEDADDEVERSEPEPEVNPLATEVADLRKKLETVLRARPAPSHVDNEGAPAAPPSDRDLVADAIRGVGRA